MIAASGLTADSSIESAIAFAMEHPNAVEITDMATNNTLYRNGVKVREAQGVIWTPDKFRLINAMFYWSSFPGDYLNLLQELRLYGKLDAFNCRNDRIDGNGYNSRICTYQLVDQGRARLSIMLDFEHVTSAVTA